MPKRYFKCDPDLYFCQATCCRSHHTQPSLSLGDFVRLSEEFKEPIPEIWRSKGSICLTARKELRNGEFILTLSLLHHPCPYLSSDDKCSIRHVRPLSCAGFPLSLYMYFPEQVTGYYKGLHCLQGARPKPAQVKLGKELFRLMMEESALEIDLMWGGKPKYLYMPRSSDFFKLAQKATDLQISRDPDSKSDRNEMILHSISSMTTIAEHFSSIGSKETRMDTSLLRYFVTPVIFSVFEDEIAEKLEKLEDQAKDVFRETSRKWRKLRKKME